MTEMTVHRHPGAFVFDSEGNPLGWIASDKGFGIRLPSGKIINFEQFAIGRPMMEGDPYVADLYLGVALDDPAELTPTRTFLTPEEVAVTESVKRYWPNRRVAA